ncbi:hypothetical protein SNEBB_011387 [Seison nebaliae]|nr:hypothetical protein SNEBB_011387 [Seison nebaliae]
MLARSHLIRTLNNRSLLRHLSISLQDYGVIGIRREDQSVWERRAPLSPDQVRTLVKKGVRVIVQPSNRRAYPMVAYEKAGAEIREDMDEANLIIGVKQVPIDSLISNKVYAFFSHTIKAQEANMDLLDELLNRNIMMCDYEKMCYPDGQRAVAFGQYAGIAGMINILHGLGLRLLALGNHTPFMHVGLAHNYRTTEMACQAIRDAGYGISLGNMPRSIGPLIFIFTGTGNVSQGAQQVFRELPNEEIDVKDLKKFAEHGATNKIYYCVVSREDHYEHKTTRTFDPEDFDNNPTNYISTFSQKIAPYASVIINGIYWDATSPKLLSTNDLKRLLKSSNNSQIEHSVGCPILPHRLLAICDISADPGGSIEFMTECTTIDKPFSMYDINGDCNHSDQFGGSGVLVCSIDNMPTQLPMEATEFFGGRLLPHIFEMLKCLPNTQFDNQNIDPIVKNAIITANKKLTPSFEYISDLRKENEMKKNVLLLGAGFVSSPVVDYLCEMSNVSIRIGSQIAKDNAVLCDKYPNTSSFVFNRNKDDELLEKEISHSSLVISLLPAFMHPKVAKMCLANNKNMVTASYISPEMKSFDAEAKEKNVVLMNEVGVDPGIDHMLLMNAFDQLKKEGKKIKKVISYCGGLPSPDSIGDSPLGYKFSWSPRGALLNCIGEAKYLLDGKEIKIEKGGDLMRNGAKKVEAIDSLIGFNLEVYPNRNSIDYKDKYGLEGIDTLIRGTYRYKGYSERIVNLIEIGLISENTHKSFDNEWMSWKELIALLIHLPKSSTVDEIKRKLEKILSQKMKGVNIIESLGLLDEKKEVKCSPDEPMIDVLSKHLAERLKMEEDDRDIIIMRHEITTSDDQTEIIDFVCYGDEKKMTSGPCPSSKPFRLRYSYSAMAKTVGLPTAIAARMILEKHITKPGVHAPLSSDIYGPMLRYLKEAGLRWTERVVQTPK